MRPGMILVEFDDRRSKLDPPDRRGACRARLQHGRRAARPFAERSRSRQAQTFLGGDPATIAKVKPIIACYADTIIETGPLGSGHTLKLINNFISIGTSAVIAEAIAAAAKLGLDLHKVYEVVSSGGANSAMFQMMMPWALEGDDSRLKGPFRIATRICASIAAWRNPSGMTSFIAQAVNQTYQLVNAQGHGERFMPVLPGILAQLNGAKIRDLP